MCLGSGFNGAEAICGLVRLSPPLFVCINKALSSKVNTFNPF